jgi:hypothetical protein
MERSHGELRKSTRNRTEKIEHRIVSVLVDRAIAQALSRWLPTAAVQGSSPGMVMWDFVVDKVALG